MTAQRKEHAKNEGLTPNAQVQIGSANIRGVMATVGGRLPGMESDGVVGLGMYSGLTVTLDYPKHELRLTHEPLAKDSEHVIVFTRERGVPQIELIAAGVPLQADVDTGSPALLSAPSSANLPFASEPRVVGHGRTSANEFEIRAADLRGDLSVAGWTLPAPTVDIVEPFPIANLGSRFLRDYAVSFDMANGRMKLEKSGRASALPLPIACAIDSAVDPDCRHGDPALERQAGGSTCLCQRPSRGGTTKMPRSNARGVSITGARCSARIQASSDRFLHQECD